MDINEQISANRKRFRVDHFDMVVSEYVNRYLEKNLILDPPYQRDFRWDIATQSALIESILIGIPLPPIFVCSNKEYVWEVIDGVQRTNTLIKFLTDDEGKHKLEDCQILTELNGKSLCELNPTVRNAIKNARLRIEMVEDNDDSYSQYLLFSRLNNNGEPLSHQELRNFLIYKLNAKFYNSLASGIRHNKCFKRVIHLPVKRIMAQEDLEYALRFFICRQVMIGESSGKENYKDIETLITKEIDWYLKNITEEQICNDLKLMLETYAYIDLLQLGAGFKTFDKDTKSLPNCTVIIPAISFFLERYKSFKDETVRSYIKDFYATDQYMNVTKQSYSPVKRFFVLSALAYDYFYRKSLIRTEA